MSAKLGLDAKLYYKVGGQGGGGSWLELSNAKDVTLNLEKGEADVTTRANQGWRATIGTLKEANVDFEMVWDTSDAGFTAISDSYFDDTIIGLQILDGAAGQGLQGDFSVTKFSRNEPLEGAITVSVTVKVTYSDTPPTWIGG
jgi:predicted secreted protein